MPNSDFITNEKDFTIPEGWSEVGVRPETAGGGAPVPQVPVDRFASGAISTMTLGLHTDIQASATSGNCPSFRIQPPQPSAIAAINSATQSIITETVATAVAAIVPPDADVPVINENVQSGTAYTVVLTDRDTLVSMTNSSGGTVTLPGTAQAFGFVQTAQGGSGTTTNCTVSLTNRLGNGMIATYFGNNGAGGPLAISDTNGNIWTVVSLHSTSGAQRVGVWYSTNVKAGFNTVGVTGFTGGTFCNLIVEEFSGMVVGGLDQHSTGLASATITPSVANTFAFTAGRLTQGSAGQSDTALAGWTNIPWTTFPATSISQFIAGVDEYILNPPPAVILSGATSGPASSSMDITIANFKTFSAASTIMPAGWYCYIENTGTGTFTVQSIANIDGASSTITLLPNTGVLVVSDGTQYWSERGVAPSITFETGGVPNHSQNILNLVAGTNISLTNTTFGNVQINATGGGALPYVMGGFIAGTYVSSQDLMAIPVDRTVNFVANFGVNTDGSTSEATLQVAATASTVFIINQIVSGTPTQIGTITFAAAGTVGTFASTGGLGHAFNAGDVMQVLAPSSPDATAAYLGFTLSGTR